MNTLNFKLSLISAIILFGLVQACILLYIFLSRSASTHKYLTIAKLFPMRGDIPIEMRIKDYLAGKDPVLEYIRK